MIHVIVLAYHGDRWLPRCLDTLARASRHKIKLTLVDNHGNQELDSLDLSAFDAEIQKPGRTLGFSEGNNFALQAGFPEDGYVVFLNQDTWGEDEWLDRCIEVLEEDEAWGAVTPVLRKYEHTEYDPSFISTLLDSHLDPTAFEGGAFVEAKHIPATAMVLKARALLQAGPFDPVFGSYYEDYDLCRRIQLAGYRIGIEPAGVVHHFSGSASQDKKSNVLRMRCIHRNRILHRLRMQSGSRIPALIYYQFIEWPRNLARGFFRRRGAQPVTVTIGVWIDMVKRWPRFLSRRRDREAWELYLEKMNWPKAP